MKKIKSLISVLLAVFMICSCALVTNAASASVTANASKTNVTEGDVITVTVNLNSSSGITAVDFTLTYNDSHLECQGVSIGSAGQTFGWNSANREKDSSGKYIPVVKGAFMKTDGTVVTATGALATIKFKVKAGASGNSPISLSATAADDTPKANPVIVSASGTNLQIAAKASTTKPTTTKPTTTKPTTTKPTTTKPTTTQPTTTEATTEGESTTKIIATETIGVKKGNVYQLAKPSAMTGKVTYSSSKTSVATVTDEGVIKTVAKGMTTITAVSENGVTKTWLLIVGDGSTVELDTTETTTSEDEETTTELAIIGSVTEEETTEEETTAETSDTNKKDNGDETFRLIFGTGAVVAVLIVIIIVVSMIRKRRSFVG